MVKRQKQNPSGLKAVILFIVVIGIAFGCVAGYRYVIRELYPMEYSDYVERYSYENRLDKYLVYAVIKSAGNTSFRYFVIDNRKPCFLLGPFFK